VEKRNVIGDQVRRARKNAVPRITQADLVARLETNDVHIDRSGLSKIESGTRPVTDIEVQALAKALKVRVAWLFGDKGE